MSDFLEEHLKNALSRQNPSEGFAERVLAKVPQRRAILSGFWYKAVAAVLVLGLLFAGYQQRRQTQERNARETERQVVFALALAMKKFDHVNQRLKQSAPKVTVQERQGNI